MKSAHEWRSFYAEERATLGERGLLDLLDRAPDVALPVHGALVFPHTRLAASGHLTAAVANAVVRSRCDTVIALGVLHGARECDADLVARARAGDLFAVETLLRVHGPDTADDRGYWTEEFSLDGFEALITTAVRRESRDPPRVIARYPFLVGDHPDDLPGLDELVAIVDAGCAMVATADPIHHGVGYGTPLAECRRREDPSTAAYARRSVEEGFGLLARGDYPGFLRHAAESRSDFRDVGPVLAALLRRGAGEITARVMDVVLVDYGAVLAAVEPTWVAGALAEFAAS